MIPIGAYIDALTNDEENEQFELTRVTNLIHGLTDEQLKVIDTFVGSGIWNTLKDSYDDIITLDDYLNLIRDGMDYAQKTTNRAYIIKDNKSCPNV